MNNLSSFKLGDIPVNIFLKHLKEQIKTTCKDNDSRQVSTIALTAIHNALVDTLLERMNNDKTE